MRAFLRLRTGQNSGAAVAHAWPTRGMMPHWPPTPCHAMEHAWHLIFGDITLYVDFVSVLPFYIERFSGDNLRTDAAGNSGSFAGTQLLEMMQQAKAEAPTGG